jgi:molybdenum ABC transporter, periplasmic molybdate-binding protein
MMKRIGTWMVAVWAAVSASHGAAAQELHVYAGAGLREAVEVVADEYRKETGKAVAVEYGGSGQMMARIQETGVGDVFVSGAMMYIDRLEAEDRVASKRPLALHGALLAVNKAAAAKVKSFDDLATPGVRIGLGDPKAMALGRTAEEILDRSGKRDAILPNVVVRAATMNQLALYVVSGDVDAAIVGHHDVMKNSDALVSIPIPEGYYRSEVVGATVLKSSPRPADAARFVEMLASHKGRRAFHAAGFPPVGH